MTPARKRKLLTSLAGLLVLGVVGWRVGSGALLRGLRAVTAGSVVAAVVLGAVATIASAWRWRAVGRALGSELALGSAVAAYYRSQFLNATLPGGVLGDAHRAVDTGHRQGDVRLAVRIVVWERILGQVVQIGLMLAALTVLPSPLQRMVPFLAAGTAVLAALVWAVSRIGRRRRTRWGHRRRVILGDATVLFRSAPAIVASSAVMSGALLTLFLVSARAVGVRAPLAILVPLGLLVLVAMSVPVNIGGWGPREGVAAWVFALAGLGAAQGLATSVTYGVLSLMAAAPGAVVLVFPRLVHRRRPARELVSHG